MPKNFSEILSDINNKSKTSLLICVTMLIAAPAMLLTQHSVGWLFAIMGAILAASLYSKHQRTQKELSKVHDFDGFCTQYDSACTKLELLGLTITDEYAVVTLPYLQIFPLKDMEKCRECINRNICHICPASLIETGEHTTCMSERLHSITS